MPKYIVGSWDMGECWVLKCHPAPGLARFIYHKYAMCYSIDTATHVAESLNNADS